MARKTAAELQAAEAHQQHLDTLSDALAAALNIDPEEIMYDTGDGTIALCTKQAEGLLALIPNAAPAEAESSADAAQDWLNGRFDQTVSKVAANLRSLADDIETTASRAAVTGERIQAAIRIMTQIHTTLPTLGAELVFNAAIDADNHAKTREG